MVGRQGVGETNRHGDVASRRYAGRGFVNGQLTRQSTFLCMTAVFEQLCESTCTDVRDWRIAACRNLRPVQVGECRLRRSTGEYVLLNAETKQALLEVPQLLLKACIRICTQVPDRSSINTSWLHYVLKLGYTLPVYCDALHGLARSVSDYSALRLVVLPPTLLFLASFFVQLCDAQ